MVEEYGADDQAQYAQMAALVSHSHAWLAVVPFDHDGDEQEVRPTQPNHLLATGLCLPN